MHFALCDFVVSCLSLDVHTKVQEEEMEVTLHVKSFSMSKLS